MQYFFKNKLKKAALYSLCILAFTASTLTVYAQYPVIDKKHNTWSTILKKVQTASLIINQQVTFFVNTIKNVNEFFHKANTIVGGIVKNLQKVKALIEIEKEILSLATNTIDALNAPIDQDGDGIDDLDFLDKWKHIQILLAISSQASNVFDMFKNVVEENSTIMDDNGRLTLIQDAYKDALKIRSSLNLQIRRINKEIYQYQRKRRELTLYKNLFN